MSTLLPFVTAGRTLNQRLLVALCDANQSPPRVSSPRLFLSTSATIVPRAIRANRGVPQHTRAQRRAEHETAVDVLCCCCGTHRQSRWFFTAIVSDVPTDVSTRFIMMRSNNLTSLSSPSFSLRATRRLELFVCRVRRRRQRGTCL